MSDEHFRESDLIRQRRENFQALSQLGIDPYPRQFERTHTVEQLVEAHGGKTGEALEAEQPRTRTAGRILAIRSFGKANFLVISDGQARIQIYIRKDALSERDFSIFKLLDFGDFVGVEGRVFRTKTNELTIWASSLEFLAKCFLPLPEKWHGLTDVETRYRQRYLDLIVNPDSRKVFAVRSRVLAAIRTFLNGRGYLEVETPMMQPIAGGALARPFVTHHNALDMQLFLRIAPELYLKRLTVGGLERVYEINRNFRNEGISTQHNPEFTMLEFYQAYSEYRELMALTEEMLSTVAREAIGTDQVQFGEHQISLAPPYRRVSLREGAREAASARLGTDVAAGDLRQRDAAAGIAARLGLEMHPQWGAGKIATEIFERLNEAGAHPADLRLRLSHRGVAALQAEARRSRHGRAVRALHRRLRGRQRLQRARTIRPSSGAASRGSSPIAPPAIRKRTPWTRTTSAPSSTACRRPPAKASASTGW